MMTNGDNRSGRETFDDLTGAQTLGMVVSGSLTDGMVVRLDADRSIEEIKVGTFVNIQGQHMRFFGVVTDAALASMDPSMPTQPPDVSDPFIAQVVSGTAAYGTITVEPMLTIGGIDSIAGLDGPQPARTVPPHFSRVGTATDTDISTVFGEEDDRHFWIGSPLDMETRLFLNIEEMVKRSNGVFGKSGTGKTFLTRLFLAGILQKDAASNLVFDRHNEYGWQGTSEGASSTVKGLKQLFPSKVAVFSLDEQSSRTRGINPDYVVRIGLEEIEPEDVQMLRESLNLSEVAADAAYSLQRKFGARGWLKSFLSISGGEEMRDLASDLNVNDRALSTPAKPAPPPDAPAVHRRREGTQLGQPHPGLCSEPGDARGPGVRSLRQQLGGIHPRGQPADSAHLRAVPAIDRRGGGRRRIADTEAAGHHY